MPPTGSASGILDLPDHAPGMRIGLLGGTFDPPHDGHRAVSLVALRSLRLDRVWWLVSPQNPLKRSPPSEDLARRVLASRAFVRHPRIAVTGIEAALGTSYTADTLRALLPRLPGVSPVWMMGADSLAGFHRWRDWQAIAATLPLAVFNRPGSAFPALFGPAANALRRWRLPERAAPSLAGREAPAWVFVSRPLIALSSTELRTNSRRAS